MPELPLDMTPGGNVIRLPTAADVSTGRSADLSSAGGGFNAKDFAKSLLMGLATVDFTGEGKTNTNAALKMFELDRLEKVEARKTAVEERKAKQAELTYRLNVAKFVKESQGAVPAGLETYLKSVKTIRNEMALSSPEARDNAIKGLQTGAKAAGLDFAATLVPDLFNATVDVMATLPDLSRHIANNPAGVLFLMNANQILEKDPTGKKFIETGQGFAAASIQQTIDARMPEVVDTLKRDPAYQGKSISFETVVSLVAGNDAAVRQYLLGQGGAPKEVHDGILKRMATLGVQTPDIGAKAAETEATELAKTTPAVTAGKAKQEDVLRAGKAATAGAEEAARLEAREGVRMPSLETRTLAVLAEQKLDPRKASTEQLQAARKEGDQRALQFEKQKEEMKAKVALGKPLTADQTNDLRLAYRREARSVVLSTEPGGIFGAVEKLEPAQKQALENRIDAKATEMATADGFPSLFARKAVSPAKSGDKGRAAAASDVQKALQDAKGDRARARELLIRRGFDPARSLRE